MVDITLQRYPVTFGLRRSALIEIVLFFLVLFIVGLIVGGSPRFFDVSPHPAWLIVIFIAVQYGTGEGLIAALASTLYLLLGNMPGQTIEQNSYQYFFYLFKLPILWFLMAVAIGELRNRHIRERNALREALEESREREQLIADSYDKVRQLKDRLELRIAGQLRSALSTYRAAQAIERNHPSDVIGGVQELIGAVMEPEQFSVFLLQDNGLHNTITGGWRADDMYARHFDPSHPLYDLVINRRQTISIVNADHERALQGQGVLAGPIIDPKTDRVIGMLKIESLGFLQLNLNTLESFTAVATWVGVAFSNAQNYQQALEGAYINPDHQLMTHSYFQRYMDYISALAKRVNFDVQMLVIKADASGDRNVGEDAVIARKIAETVRNSLRTVDLAFDYQQSGGEYSIVMPATDQKGAEIVLERVRKSLDRELRAVAPDARVNYTLLPLHQKVA